MCIQVICTILLGIFQLQSGSLFNSHRHQIKSNIINSQSPSKVDKKDNQQNETASEKNLDVVSSNGNVGEIKSSAVNSHLENTKKETSVTTSSIKLHENTASASSKQGTLR